MCMGDSPFTPDWEQLELLEEVEYLRELGRRSIEDQLLAEEEYGDGGVVIAPDDFEWSQVDFWRWQ